MSIDQPEMARTVSDEQRGDAVDKGESWSEMQDVQHVHAQEEFEEQVFGRLHAKGLDVSRLTQF
jgi:hypothetical protein